MPGSLHKLSSNLSSESSLSQPKVMVSFVLSDPLQALGFFLCG